jgi:hypothetical protein
MSISLNFQTRNYSASSKLKAKAELERRQRERAQSIPVAWQLRIPAMLGRYFWHGFSQPHAELWDWAEGIDKESSPRPFIALWPRGRGKSTMAESVAVDCGVRKARTYCMYVSGTQDQADKHVQTIARMLELDTITQFAPGIGKPKVSQNGNRTWNRAMVSTSTGYTVEAIGLNKAVRGQKIDWARPDLIIFDDVDEKHDTEVTTTKKEEIITDSILPAGAANCAVLFAQNLVHTNSIAHRLSKLPSKEGAANYLIDRIISGPYRAMDDLKYDLRRVGDIYRWEIISGKSIWQGFDKDICEAELNRVGPTAYERESQNNVDVDNPNALMSAADFDRTRVVTHPDLVRVAVAVDPPGGATECGIVAGGKALVNGEWHGYTKEDATQPAGVTPEKWALEVLKCYHRNKADVIFVERNYGGDMVASTIRQTKWVDDEGNVIVDGRLVHIEEVNATRGKQVRAEPIALLFQQGRCHHVGQLAPLEKEWRQWVPGDTNSPNRLDAEAWLYTGLMLGTMPLTPPLLQAIVKGWMPT